LLVPFLFIFSISFARRHHPTTPSLTPTSRLILEEILIFNSPYLVQSRRLVAKFGSFSLFGMMIAPGTYLVDKVEKKKPPKP
jgi:hypothetical protein